MGLERADGGGTKQGHRPLACDCITAIHSKALVLCCQLLPGCTSHWRPLHFNSLCSLSVLLCAAYLRILCTSVFHVLRLSTGFHGVFSTC